MTIAEQPICRSRSGWLWVPTLYLAEGLPAALITTVSLVMFTSLVGSEGYNGKITGEEVIFWTGLYSLPWMLRALWAPVIDRVGTPRTWAIVMQAVMGGCFVAAGAAVAAGASEGAGGSGL